MEKELLTFPTSPYKGRQKSDGPAQLHYPDPTGRAKRIIKFIESFELWEGKCAGQRFKLHPFQKAIIYRVFGPSKEDGSRLIREANIWVPRGNGKTPLCAALALAFLMGPEAEEGGQITLAAADLGDATTAYRHCHHMALQKELPKHELRPRYSRKELEYHTNNSILKAISMEPYSKYSYNVSFFLCDEIHAWPEIYARDLFNIITDSMAKRANPLTVSISVAPQGQGGIAWEKWDYTLKVLKGEIDDPTFAAIVFAAPPDCDWKDEKIWHAVNPALKYGMISVDELRSKAKKAAHSPADQAGFKRYHLNIPQEGVAEPWLDLAIYDQQEARRSLDELAGQQCWVGVDLSSKADLTAVCALFPTGNPGNRAYDVLAHFFLPEAKIAEKAEQDRADYLTWAREGFLTLTPGNVIDQRTVVDHICDLGERYDVQEVDVDPYRSTDPTNLLHEAGFTVVQVGQGFLKMADPLEELKRSILNGQFRHEGNPLLRMCFGNAVAIADGHDNEKLVKKRSSGRIDGAVASANAIARIMQCETEGTSVYEQHRPEGFLFV